LRYTLKEVEMKAAIAAVALSAVALATPIGAAQARTVVAVRVDTPVFGLRFGAPGLVVAPLPVVVHPVYMPPPVYAPPVPVAYVPPRVVLRAPVVYPVVYRHVHGPVVKYGKHGRWHGRQGVTAVGYAYGD
jgi:hypothetical protein